QAGNSVEALLRQKIKWFLLDRQRKHDPVGYRAFMNLVAVVEAMITAGAATATNLVRRRVRNPTILRLTSTGHALPASRNELARLIDSDPAWQPVLLRLGKLGKGAQELLRKRLDQFSSLGVAAFQVGEFGALLKERVRAANEAWHRPSPNVPSVSEPDDLIR